MTGTKQDKEKEGFDLDKWDKVIKDMSFRQPIPSNTKEYYMKEQGLTEDEFNKYSVLSERLMRQAKWNTYSDSLVIWLKVLDEQARKSERERILKEIEEISVVDDECCERIVEEEKFQKIKSKHEK